MRACGLAGPHSARYTMPVPAGPSFCLFVCLFGCLFVCSLVRLFLCLGVCVFPMAYAFAQALIVLSFFKPVVDLRRRAVGHEVDGAPFNTQARLVTASNG